MYQFAAGPWSLASDIRQIVDRAAPDWLGLRGARLFITGGTGFIGRWLLESLASANAQHSLDIHVTILTRDPFAFTQRAPHLATAPGFHLWVGDILQFEIPDGHFSHIIHAATDTNATLNQQNPLRLFNTIVQGTQRVLDMAVSKGVERLLYLSSGAVYGAQPWELERVPETWLGGPDSTNPRAAYGEGKRAAEMLGVLYAKQYGLSVVTARIFALLGPFLALNQNFAAGNFIRDTMAGRPVVVKGNGQPCRSYLYSSDLTVWLWRLLTSGKSGTAYNVGSENTVSIKELAERVSSLLGNGNFEILNTTDTGWNPGRYVPDTRRIREELGLDESVSLNEAICRTAHWYRSTR